jgi:hypothetical protein
MALLSRKNGDLKNGDLKRLRLEKQLSFPFGPSCVNFKKIPSVLHA